jgi:hypothetical protein
MLIGFAPPIQKTFGIKSETVVETLVITSIKTIKLKLYKEALHITVFEEEYR